MFRSGKSLASLLGIGLALGVHGVAEASSAVPYSQRTTELLEAQNPLTCGVSCKYDKANENLSFEAFYLNEKLVRLKDRADQLLSPSDPNYDRAEQSRIESELVNNMTGYCKKGEGAKDCFMRFGRAQTARLREIRGSMIENASMSSKLNSKGTPVQYERDEKSSEPPPLLPLLPGTDEFRAENKNRVEALNRQRVLTSIDYQKWLEDFPRPPDPSAFVRVTPVPRDPENPSAGTLEIPEVDASGKMKIDQAAYDAAKKKYEEKLKLSNADKSALLDEFGKPSKVKLEDIQTLDRPLTISAFRDTREAFVSAYNDDQTKKKKEREPATSTKAVTQDLSRQKPSGPTQETQLAPGKAGSSVNLKWDMDKMSKAIADWEKYFLE